MNTPYPNKQLPIYLIALGAFALGMASYVTAGLIPLIEASFSVSVAVAAQLVTAFTLAYGLGSPICGTRASATVSPQTRPFWQTKRNMPASIW